MGRVGTGSLVLLLACAGCRSAPSDSALDPARAEVPLPTLHADWRASLVLDNGETGVWTVKPAQVFEQYACPELVALDDEGRCIVLVSYSGKWTPNRILEEKGWFGGLDHGDVDPRIEGAEIYLGGEKGNLYQVVSYRHGALDARLIAHLPGREIHTIVSGRLDPRLDVPHVLVFTRPGGLYRVAPTGPDGKWETKLLQEMPGRVRDALVWHQNDSDSTHIVTAARTGEIAMLTLDRDGPHWSTIFHSPVGKGRLATGPDGVVYSTQDDGVVLRHERTGPDAWRTETIHVGAQGPRGLVAGRFDPDPSVETVAVFGYSKRVELLTRRASGWEAETLFEARDKGHWLDAAELDGRNETLELVGSGYGGRVFLLARAPSAL